MVPRPFAAARAMRSRTCADVIQPCSPPLGQAGYIIDLNILNLTENNSLSFISQVRLTLNEEITRHQLNLIKHNKKLTLYSMFKTYCHIKLS